MFLARRSELNENEERAYCFAPKLYRLAFARLGNSEDAEDAVQETYFKALSSMSKFKAGTNMESWLTTILLNTIRDHRRKLSNSAIELSIDDLTAESALLPTSLVNEKNPESILEDKEMSSELTFALRELPEFFLTPLLLRDIQDLTYKDIASCLNIPIGTVMSRLSRARDFLRQRLTGMASAEKPASPLSQPNQLKPNLNLNQNLNPSSDAQVSDWKLHDKEERS